MAVVLIIVCIIFWIWQFISLMNLPDSVFIGRFDKALWAAALILLNVLGALAFFFWKLGKRTDELADNDVQRVFENAAGNES